MLTFHAIALLSLDVLTRRDSITLLRQFVPDLARTDANMIAAELGDLPLALHLASSFLTRYGTVISPAAYVDQLRDKDLLAHPSLEGRGETLSPTNHELPVGRTFALSYDRLDLTNETDAKARQLLTHAACFAPGEPISRELLIATVTRKNDKPESFILAADSLNRLLELGLLRIEAHDMFLLHRLLAEFVRGISDVTVAQLAVERALLDALVDRTDQAGYMAWLPMLAAHLRVITERALPRRDAPAASLCIWLGYHLHDVGDYFAAQFFYEQALANDRQTLGEHHPATAQSLSNLGHLFEDMGDLLAAKNYYKQVLAIRQQRLRMDLLDIVQSLNRLQDLLTDVGDSHGIKIYLERAKRTLAIYRLRLSGPPPFSFLSLDNFTGLFKNVSDPRAVEHYFKQALVIGQETLSTRLLDIAVSFNDLGTLFLALDDLPTARNYLKQALDIRRQELGKHHLHTAQSLNNLGLLLKAVGDYRAARYCLKQALTICQQELGEHHPLTAASLNNLGSLLRAVDDYSAARNYFEQALVIRRQHLSEYHPDTANSCNNLGVLLHDAGEFSAARSYLQQSLVIFERMLGPEHPQTNITRANLETLLDE